MAKLITEAAFEEFHLIKEDVEAGKPQPLIIEGIYIQADKKNGNGRIYEYESLKRTVDKFIAEKVNSNQALEELEHPTEITINPDRVCCRTISLTENSDHTWTGRSLVLASDPDFGIKGTPCGDIVKSLLQFDTKLGHSTRGVGEVTDEGIVTDYQLICIDTVLSPSIGIFNDSNGNRFINGILESKNFIINTHGEILEETYDNFEKKLAKLPVKKADRQEKLVKAVDEFFKALRG